MNNIIYFSDESLQVTNKESSSLINRHACAVCFFFFTQTILQIQKERALVVCAYSFHNFKIFVPVCPKVIAKKSLAKGLRGLSKGLAERPSLAFFP